jgi:hypothetical protein
MTASQGHGTYAAAQHCDPRCPACRRAVAAYMRGYRKRKKRGKMARAHVNSPWPESGLGWPP